MVDLAHLSPDQKSLVIRGDANYQFVYVNHQPVSISRLNRELINKISNSYNGSIAHDRILSIHSSVIDIIKETDIDKISAERITPIMEKLIAYDYSMFIDLMTILAAMLEAKDLEKISNYIDYVVDCSDHISRLEAENSCDTAEVSRSDSPSSIMDENECVTVDDETTTEEHIESTLSELEVGEPTVDTDIEN